MKVLFALGSVGNLVAYEAIVRALCARGNDVVLLCGAYTKTGVSDRILQRCIEDNRNCSTGTLRARARWTRLAESCRALLSCACYGKPVHPAKWLRNRWERNTLPRAARWALRIPGVRALTNSRWMEGLLRSIENRLLADPGIIDQLKAIGPDVVFASPYIYARSQDVEYVKAARALGIPTVVSVLSWDNLTTKGTFPVAVDRVMVWNEALAEEATTIHGIPHRVLVITGAPRFDPWFSMGPTIGREEFLDQLGFSSERRMLVYICSSSFIAANETQYVQALACALAANPATANVVILVRPYPTNAEIWIRLNESNIVIHPRRSTVPDSESSRALFFDTLFHSDLVVGINTSAFLEAAIVGRPCMTVLADDYHETQRGIAHFRHLMDGRFIETAASVSEAVGIVERVTSGEDRLGENRRAFVGRFVRPRGMTYPVGEVIADELEVLVAGTRAR